MDAVISCGGRGERLSPITDTIPKCLVQVNGKSVIEWQLDSLVKFGINRVFLLTGHRSEQIYEKLFSYPDTKISFIKEKKELGSFGGINKISRLLEEDFIFIHGDILFNFDFHNLIYKHKLHRAFVTSVLHITNHPKDSNLVQVSKNGVIQRVFDKGQIENSRSLSMAGIHVISKSILKNVPLGKVSIENDFIIPILNTGNVRAYITEEYIKDMGTHERLEEVRNEFKKD